MPSPASPGFIAVHPPRPAESASGELCLEIGSDVRVLGLDLPGLVAVLGALRGGPDMIAMGNRRLWLCGEPVDMRKGIDGLIAVVQQRLLREVLSGDVFLFVGRNPSRLKILCWDRDGYWLATKRLSQGRFQVPRASGSNGVASSIELSASEWQLILDGIVVRDRTVLVRHGR